MYLRVTRGRLGEADPDEFVRTVEVRTLAVARHAPGLRGFHLGVDRAAGTFCAVSQWDLPGHAGAIEVARPALEALGARFEAPEIFEVVAQL
jgi:hypothetical protein